MKKFTLSSVLMALLFLAPALSWGQDRDAWTENFNDQTSNTYGNASYTINERVWTCSDAGNFSYGNTTMGSPAFTINDDKVGAHITSPALNTCGTVGFKYAFKSGSSTNVFVLQKSTNGTDWTDLDTHTLGDAANESYVDYSYDVNDASASVYIRILSDDQNAHLFIDDYYVTNYTASTTCDVTFQVDMQNQVVGGSVYLAGSFNGWNTTANEMLDGDSDGIYEATVTVDKNDTYEYKFLNGATWESVPGACANGSGNREVIVADENTISIDPVCFGECVACNILDWYNLQWPGTADILSTENETIYAQAYEPGVTDNLGNEDDIECWIGYSTSDTDPSTWTDWVVAAYDAPDGNNYQYKADLGADQSLVGTYYYASRFSYNSGDYTYGGFNGGAWDGTANVSGVLNVTAVATIPYSETFATSIGDWIEYSVASNRDWYHTSDYMRINGYGGDVASDDYLISPIFNLDNYSNEYISFDSWTNYTDLIAGLELLYTTNYTGDPATTVWETLNPTLPDPDTEEWTGSGNVDISGIAGTAVRFAIHYETTGTGGGTTTDWRVKNVVLGTAAPATATWSGATDTDWFTATNWDNGVPGATTDVTVPAGLTNYPTITAAASCNTLAMAEGATILGFENLTLAGNATFTQNHTGGTSGGGKDDVNAIYHMVSSPVVGATAISVFPSTSFVRSYDETTASWVNLTGTDVLAPGTGYSLWMPDGASNVEYTGTLTTGTVSSGALSLSNSGNANFDGWHLLGNPFAAALDFDLGTWNLNNVNNSVSVWKSATGNYITSGGDLTDNVIPVGQAFFVQASVDAATMDIPLDACVHNSTSVYKENRTNYFALNITNDANSYSDNTFVRFGQAYANEYETEDATKMYGLAAAPQIYTMEGEHKLKINSRKSAEDIALNLEAGIDATYTFTVSEFSIDGEVILEDKQTGHTEALAANSTYSFTASPEDPAGRFVLHFNGMTDVEETALEGVQVYAANNAIYVNYNAAASAEISVYTVAGQKVMTATATQGLNSLKVNNATGNYLVRIISAQGTMTEKVFVK